MGVTCEILLTNTNNVYRAGDSVEGTVRYVIDKPTEFIRVTLSLKRKELFYWEPITPIDILQASESEPVMIQAGSYDEPFCFVLPDEIPSSYKDFKCFISFFLQLEFVKPESIIVPQVFYIQIEVETDKKPRPDVKYSEFKVDKEFNTMFPKKTVTLKAGIIMPVYLEKRTPVCLDIYNLTEIPIVSIKTELIEYVSNSYGHYVQQNLKATRGIEYTFLGLNRLKPRHSFDVYFEIKPDKFSIHSETPRKKYRIRVTVKFLFPHRDLCMEISEMIEGPSVWQVMKEKPLMENNERKGEDEERSRDAYDSERFHCSVFSNY